MDVDNRGGIVGDAAVVEGETNGAFERLSTMLGGVRHHLREDAREGMDSPKLVVGDFNQDGEQLLLDQEEIVVRWLSIDGRKRVVHLLKAERDCARHRHGDLRGFLGAGWGL